MVRSCSWVIFLESSIRYGWIFIWIYALSFTITVYELIKRLHYNWTNYGFQIHFEMELGYIATSSTTATCSQNVIIIMNLSFSCELW